MNRRFRGPHETRARSGSPPVVDGTGLGGRQFRRFVEPCHARLNVQSPVPGRTGQFP
jgi:hypothetical protein